MKRNMEYGKDSIKIFSFTSMVDKIRKWWLFHVQNPLGRSGEKGAFKWKFRRYTLDISTISENFKVRFTASEHPYGYLLMGDSDQTLGYAQRLYMIATLMTTEQKFVDDLDKAIDSYQKRLQKKADVKEDDTEEKIAIEEVKQVQEVVEMPKKERKKYERDVNGRFKAAVKKAEKLAE